MTPAPRAAAPPVATATPAEVPAGVVRLRRADGQTRDVRVEIAADAASRGLGLMRRASMPEDAGMLFVFEADTDGSFWMKDTLIPLSIAFIDASGRIIDIKDMQPLSETLVPPAARYRYALEVNQGYFARHGIKVGDVAEFRR